jgi:glutathione S-transferase
MSLTLYGVPLSPFVRKTRICLLEKGLEYQMEMVMPFTPPDWYRQLNPLGRIPSLKDGELCLTDSSVICQYLEEQYANTPRLYGNDAGKRSRIRWLEKYADYELAPQATFTIFRNRLLKPSEGQPCDEQAVQTALCEGLPPHLDYLEQQLGDQPFFVGGTLSMADIAVATQLQNMEYGGEHLDAVRWPGLAAHYARVQQLGSWQSLMPGEQRTCAKLRQMAQKAAQG